MISIMATPRESSSVDPDGVRSIRTTESGRMPMMTMMMRVCRLAAFVLVAGTLACERETDAGAPAAEAVPAPRTSDGAGPEAPAPFDTTSRVDIGAVSDTAPEPPR